MQLKQKTSLRIAIAGATCSLLGSLPATPVIAAEVERWQVDTSLFYYGEGDGRVQDISLRAAIRRVLANDRVLNFDLSVDSLTGASPTGAVPTDFVQTFTRPSGNGSYQIAAGELPLDDTFKDTRVAVTGNWQSPIGETARIEVGFSASNEYDYLHLGVDGRYEHDFNQKNTTLFLGAAYGQDDIDPEGGTPIPFAVMQGLGNNASKRGTDSKDIVDALVGMTQILSRRSLLTMTYSIGTQNGYLNDPFKVLTVIDGSTGRPVAGPGGSGLQGRYLYESRPDTRTKQSLFTEWRYAFDRDSMAINYRFLTDDWGIRSHTLEARYRINVSAQSYFEPLLRYYTQTAADFYRSYLINGQSLPRYATADYRLADMDALTAGLKYAHRTSTGEYSVRLEYYRQTATTDDPKIGVLANFDLTPPLTAVIAQFGYKFKF